MQLIGMLDSPYVRRVAISLAVLGLPFEHRSVSVFRHFDEFAKVNPVVKAPTFIEDDGTVLIDSSLILDHIDHKVAPACRLLPEEPAARLQALSLIGFALAATEKAMQEVYERNLRPQESQYEPWIERVQKQMHAAFGVLEERLAGHRGWLCGERLMQPDITVAVAWRFTQFMLPGALDDARYPALAAFSERAEALPEFIGAPLE
ncbi:glutathione S-transferase family protein [Paraburkholderia phenazinium]|jgi:glutathione S-transferase|uniref:Glutathione S-transferase n=1 Tax=Paraburkholderia phenazinium TaxID=60549 RepID=A0A1G7YW80_9BURK|nr:glutathione S-transferase family protein [Paraburkholderia phenazinium]SDH00731.1 Glutathione S-transferase [Paraburkholderia phenazinium]